LLRSWRAGNANHNAYLEDYAALILGLLALYQTDPNPRWFTEAKRLTNEMVAHFSDPEGGFFDTRDDHETLLVRPKDLQDNATPSGNSLAATALLQLASYTGDGALRDAAERSLGGLQPAMIRYPTAFGQWLYALDIALGPVQEIAIVGPHPARETLTQVIWEQYNPRRVVAINDEMPLPGAPPLLENRPLHAGQSTAYVCEHFVCLQPVNSPEDLKRLIEPPA
jgi:uncharacterized protein YyaL (SSP411 family)